VTRHFYLFIYFINVSSRQSTDQLQEQHSIQTQINTGQRTGAKRNRQQICKNKTPNKQNKNTVGKSIEKQ
jgi:hypothetical protein